MTQMLMSSSKLRPSNPATTLFSLHTHPHSPRFLYHLPSPIRRRFILQSHFEAASPILKTSEESEPSVSSQYTSSVGSPTLHLSHWNLTHRHVLVLNVIACAVAISATWLFLSAIPALLAFKRAAESLEKLMDVTREELPDTMATIRLSGMEISDLTMELSDLGQEITQGVKNSTRAVRVAEERLREFTTKAPSENRKPKN